MISTQMCDKASRVWCCRILLVLSVLGVLCTMIFQIWSYYFSLVRQMDEQTFETPQVLAFIHACDTEKFSWNSNCAYYSDEIACTFDNPTDAISYVDYVGKANITESKNSLIIRSLEGCVRITIWAIPW